MSFVLDTDTCSAYMKGHRAIASRFIQHSGGLYMSTVTLAELYTWAYRTAASPKRLQTLANLLSDVQVLPVDDQVAVEFGRTHAQLLDQGLVVATADLLIAATALNFNFTVVTHNTKHFERVPGLRILDWLA